MKRPLIGIGPHFILSHEKSESIGCYKNYIEAVTRAGGDPVILTPYVKDRRRLAKLLDGFLFQGGGDIHPRFFRSRILRGLKLSLSPDDRTRFDLDFLGEIMRLDKPVLGICLGAQTLNVSLGGDIVQDIPTQLPGSLDHRGKPHETVIEAGSKLRKIVGATRIVTNTFHHQSIRKVGKGLVVSARSDDGVIEAVESTKHRYAIGLQWHPEKSADTTVSRRVFKSLIDAC